MRAKRSVGTLLPVFMIVLMGIVLKPARVNGQVAQRGPDQPANKSSTLHTIFPIDSGSERSIMAGSHLKDRKAAIA